MAEKKGREEYISELNQMLNRNREKLNYSDSERPLNSDYTNSEYYMRGENLGETASFNPERNNSNHSDYFEQNMLTENRDNQHLTEYASSDNEYSSQNLTEQPLNEAQENIELQETYENLHDIDIEDEKTPVKKKNRRIREAERQLIRQNRAKRTAIQIILGIIASGFVIFFGVKLGTGVYDALIDFTGISNNEFKVIVEIPDNPSLEDVISVLKQNGVISDAEFFKKYVLSKEDELEAFVGGEFELSSSMSYSSIVNTLLASKNELVTVEITVIEGMTAYQIAQLLEKNFVCRAADFLKFYKNKMNVYDFELRVLESSHKFNQMEGYLFPDKYEFYVNNKLKNHPDEEIDTSKSAEDAAKKMYSNFNSKITKTMYKKMNEMGLTLDELITLASMVQSEVGNIDDMKAVASVFLNRLKSKGEFSKLQSDVTVFYVQNYIEPYYKDYKLQTSLAVISEAYDTYECDGIPAGPICNPGMDAIGAVLDAAPTEYYYFCSNETTGETYYGKTLAEHEANLVKAGLR